MADSGPEDADGKEDVDNLVGEIFSNFMRERLSGKGDEDTDSNKYGGRNQAEVGRLLAQIGDDIGQKYRDEFDQTVARISNQSAARNLTGFLFNMRRLVQLIASATSVSGEAFKRLIRSLLMLWGNPDLAQAYAKDEVPKEVLELDDNAYKIYLKALQTGKEEMKHIRLMVVGMFGVGKTTLVQNILEEKIGNVKSTEGIDVHVNQCYVDESGKWISTDCECSVYTDYTERLKQIIKKIGILSFKPELIPNTNQETSDSKNSDIEIIYQRSDKENRVQGQITTPDEFDGILKEDVSLDRLKEVLDSFKRDDDPVLFNFNKKIFGSKFLGPSSEFCEDSQITVSIWDFAGQYIYYSTHHFFLNSRSVYLLVMDISRPLESPIEDSVEFSPSSYMSEDYSCSDAFKFWLKSIHTYARMEKGVESTPTVILVGTHKDKISGTEEEKHQYKEKYFNDALESFIGTPILKHVHPKKFFVDNNTPGAVFQAINDEIVTIAEKQSHWKESVPAKWILLERSIEIMKTEGKEMITFEDLVQAEARNEFPVGDEDELKLFLKFQHTLGNILYFDTDVLEKYVILSPQWIIDVFRCFVSHFPEKDPLQLDMWKEYEELAILKPELIDAIIEGNRDNSCFVDYKNEVIKYMEHLDVMAKPSVLVEDKETASDEKVEKDNNETTGFSKDKAEDKTQDETNLKTLSNKNNSDLLDSKIKDNVTQPTEKLNFHIVPCMLKAKPSDEDLRRLLQPENAQTTPVLGLVFSDGFMPPAVFHQLLAICIRKWPVSRRENHFLMYNGLAVFDLTQVTTLTLWFYDNVIYARLALYTQRIKNVESKICVEVRTFIENRLVKILGIHRSHHASASKDRQFEEYIQCDRLRQPSRGMGLLRVANFLEHDEIKCDAHSSSHVVTRDFAMKQWFDGYGTRTLKPVTTDDLKRVPTEKELDKLASKIGDEYWNLGICLGISNARMQQLRDQNLHNVRTRIFHVLIEWKQTGENVSLGKLKTAMQEVYSDPRAFEYVFG